MNKNIKKIIISVIIAILIEIFICNAQELCTFFLEEKDVPVEYSVTTANSESVVVLHDSSTSQKIKKGTSNIIIKNIDYEVCNIRIYYKNHYNVNVKYEPFIKPYGNTETEIAYSKKIMPANKDNTYINLRTEGNGNQIRISVSNDNAEYLEIDKIIVNSTKLNIKFERIIVFFLLALLMIYIRDGKIFQVKFNTSSIEQKCLYYGCISVISILLLFYYSGTLFDENTKIFTKDYKSEQMLLQTESFLNGSLEIQEEPSKELLNLENPYDKSARVENDVRYLFDVSYYKGNYYQYFTILPIILLVIPIKFLSGYYITTAAVNVFLLILTNFLIAKLIKKLIERYIPNISLFNLILTEITVITASSVLILARGFLNEVAELFGIINLIGTLLLIISIEKDSKIKPLKLILVGITTAFIVVSKPTFVAWYILILPLLFKVLYDKNKKKLNKQLITTLYYYCIPIAIIGLLQMIYNYARYDSIFEFGAKYQLTIYDMNVLMSLSLPKLLKGLSIYLFKFPKIDFNNFPFISILDTEQVTSSLGALTFEFFNLGLLVVPIFWSLFLKKKVLDKTNQKEKELSKLINVVIVISTIIMLLNIAFAGMSEQYVVQCKVMLAISSLLILLKGLEKKKISQTTFIILCVVSILIVLPTSLSTLGYFLERDDIDLVIKLKNTFEFWK